MNRALDTALDYLVMVAITVAPVFFPRVLDEPVSNDDVDRCDHTPSKPGGTDDH